MTIISSVILAIIVILVAISATCLLKLDGTFFVTRAGARYRADGSVERLRREIATPTAAEIGRAMILGILAGAANYCAQLTVLPVLPVASLVVMIILYCLISAWWSSDEYGGDRWSEMAPFIVLALLFVCPTYAAAAGVVTALKVSGIWAIALMRLPICVFILAVGFFIANMFFFLSKYPKEGGE